MKHLYCKKCNNILPEWDTTCEKCGYFNGGVYSVATKRTTLKDVIIALLIAVIVIIMIFLASFSSLFIEAYKDKRSAIKYVDNNYPRAEFVEGYYKTMEFRPGASKPYNQFIFEDNGMRFVVYVGEGKITLDTYYEAKAEKYILEKYIDGFMNEREISPQIMISFFGGIDEEIQNFKGHISISIVQEYIDGSPTPEQIDWFYDFYQYWIESCELPDCSVVLTYLMPEAINTDVCSYSVWFQNGERTFSSKKDFYNAFLQ